MALYLLDTNVCIDALRDNYGTVAQAISDHMAQGDRLVTSSIVQYELEIGALRSANPPLGLARIAAFLADGFKVFAFDEQAATVCAQLTKAAQLRGQNLQAYDALIAGHALALGATLVTADAKLAAAVTEVDVVSWR